MAVFMEKFSHLLYVSLTSFWFKLSAWYRDKRVL